ncbi:MAG: recombinase family protein [Candidatus Peribacteraceae bacterium]|nr:recombinase family protein [Candidatus Peribacteraceae bacterium]
MKYIGYYRVSTEKQGESGLGLESQRQFVRAYVDSVKGDLIEEYTEIESGGNVDRIYLNEAMDHAEAEEAIIVVKRMDRLSRELRIASLLKERDIRYLDCESPNDSGFMKNIKFAFAEEEKDKIGERIGSALGIIKQNIDTNGYHISKKGNKITTLGNKENLGGVLAIERSVATRRKAALLNPDNIRASGVIKLMRGYGATYNEMTKFLNENGFKTSKGNDFSKTQVRKLFDRLENQ